VNVITPSQAVDIIIGSAMASISPTPPLPWYNDLIFFIIELSVSIIEFGFWSVLLYLQVAFLFYAGVASVLIYIAIIL
jgi:hypothetical protein